MNVEKSSQNTFDAIIIGSGIGGLTTGAILSNLNKKRVLILEKHFEIGGLTHVFSRGRYKWEVGVHYIGRMKEGMIQRVIFDYITNKRLKWLPITNLFEKFIYPDFSFSVPSSPRKYQDALIEKYPSNTKEIKRYFKDVKRSANWFARLYFSGFLPKPLALLMRLINHFTSKTPLLTTGEYLAQHITNEHLAATLASQWGDYGAPPSEGAFVMHSAIVNHYLAGGYFPEGGSNRIASTIENVIERNGGMILVNRAVKEIIVENNRAVGVTVIDKRFSAEREQTFYAPVIISNCGAENTYNDLLNEPSVSQLKETVSSLEKGYSAITLYLGLKDSPEKLGVHGENIWINSKNVHGTMKEQTDALFSGEPEICYVSFPSVRSGQKGNHIAIVIALVNYSAFAEWEKQSWRMKDPSYYALKKRLTESLVSTVEKKLPGFSELIRYSEMSTPLTMNYFASRAKGAMYGFKPTPRFMSKKWFNVKTPIKGLYLTGTDVCSPGVVGAMMGGLAAASVLNGPLGFIKIVASARIALRKRKPQFTPPAVNSIRPDYSITSDKILAKLIDKVQLTDTTFEFTYQSSKEIDYCPGQYARIQFCEANYGSYSIVTAKDKVLKFIIETKFGGMYADYFLSLEPGDYSSIRLPLGDFVVRQSDNKKIFISTGTGIAPQLAMIDVISSNRSDKEIDIYFGCSYAKDNFITRYLQDFEKKININLYICISREKKEGFIHGRVTAPLNEIKDNLQKCDFYISGNPLMVAETVGILRKKGAPTIFSENF